MAEPLNAKKKLKEAKYEKKSFHNNYLCEKLDLSVKLDNSMEKFLKLISIWQPTLLTMTAYE